MRLRVQMKTSGQSFFDCPEVSFLPFCDGIRGRGHFAAGPDRECPGVFFSVAACLACTTVQIALSHRWLEGSVSVLWNGCGGRGHACRGGRRLGEPEFPAVPLFCRGLCRRRPVRLSAANVAALRAFAANVSLASGSRRALRHDAWKDEPDARLVRPEAEILPVRADRRHVACVAQIRRFSPW